VGGLFENRLKWGNCKLGGGENLKRGHETMVKEKTQKPFDLKEMFAANSLDGKSHRGAWGKRITEGGRDREKTTKDGKKES